MYVPGWSARKTLFLDEDPAIGSFPLPE